MVSYENVPFEDLLSQLNFIFKLPHYLTFHYLDFSQDIIEKAENQANLTIGVIASILVVILTVVFKILFGGKKSTIATVSFFLLASTY